MPQIIVIGLIGAGLWLGWRAVKREMARVDRKLREAEAEAASKEAPIPLERDPETGVYAPKDGHSRE